MDGVHLIMFIESANNTGVLIRMLALQLHNYIEDKAEDLKLKYIVKSKGQFL